MLGSRHATALQPQNIKRSCMPDERSQAADIAAAMRRHHTNDCHHPRLEAQHPGQWRKHVQATTSNLPPRKLSMRFLQPG